MIGKSFSMSIVIPVEPEVLFKAWQNSREHSKFTGSPAKINPKIGGKFSAWDGYIPEGQSDEYKKGWKDFYFEPMMKYYL